MWNCAEQLDLLGIGVVKNEQDTLFTALLLIAANIRKIRAWRALTARASAATAQRARRRRTSLRDYPPDG